LKSDYFLHTVSPFVGMKLRLPLDKSPEIIHWMGCGCRWRVSRKPKFC